MKNLFLIFLFSLLFTNYIFSQSREVQAGNIYKSVKIRFNNGELKKAKNFIYLNDSTISFINSESNVQTNIESSKINYISVINGDYAGEYALYGGLIGLTSTLYAWADTSQRYGYVPFDVLAPVMLGFTVGCGAIGALIGVCNPKYKRLYLPTKTNSLNYYLTPNINSQFCGLSLVCQLK